MQLKIGLINSWYSIFDLRSTYHQMALNPTDADKAALITRRCIFVWHTMPRALCNAGATFPRLMDVPLTGLNLDVCLTYFDDITLYLTTLRQHIDRLAQALGRLKQAKLSLKPSKCCLMQAVILFLGHIVSSDGMETDPAKVQNGLRMADVSASPSVTWIPRSNRVLSPFIKVYVKIV